METNTINPVTPVGDREIMKKKKAIQSRKVMHHLKMKITKDMNEVMKKM